jgi:hypothetical protein
MDNMQILPGDIFLNVPMGSWFRVTKIEDTKKGRTVRFQMGTSARPDMTYSEIGRLKKWKQSSMDLDRFQDTVKRFRVLRSLAKV